MTVENLEANGNQSTEEHTEEHAVDSNENKGREALALSVNKGTLLPNNRPIEPSHLEVVGTYSSLGANRPIAKGSMKISSSITVSGHRPIAVSTLNVSETHTIMGNRPVASNEIDDPASLMGYLD
ncbi:MAG: hypothetical protein QNJ41_06480 [Xenococcaceae cyanobacterium MO_188.B32]|nr:hypothetical protein [Xenococcaceae cyanobacterium MO_188.B32]